MLKHLVGSVQVYCLLRSSSHRFDVSTLGCRQTTVPHVSHQKRLRIISLENIHGWLADAFLRPPIDVLDIYIYIQAGTRYNACLLHTVYQTRKHTHMYVYIHISLLLLLLVIFLLFVVSLVLVVVVNIIIIIITIMHSMF